MFSHDDQDLWENMWDAHDKGFLIAASAGATKASKQLLEEMGLIGFHSYGVLAVEEVDVAGEKERLIKLRNPWGLDSAEWTGEWCDDSDLWDARSMNKAKLDAKQDGVFWMAIEDFIDRFSYLYVCRIVNDWKHN